MSQNEMTTAPVHQRDMVPVPVADEKNTDINHVEQSRMAEELGNEKRDAGEAETYEANMTVLQAVARYPMACFWATVMSSTIIMECYSMFLVGNFVAIPAFAEQFGVYYQGAWVIEASWQSALFCAGQVGALIGVFLAGPLTSRLGYRWATIIALVGMNAVIFISYFANSLPVLFVGQLIAGLPWGIFIANSPAYCSEVVPLRLRAPMTQMLQMFWSIGGIILAVVTYKYALVTTADSYKIPLALQWIFPTPLLVLFIFAPESPWWLVRKQRYDQALRSIERLGKKQYQNAPDVLAMMRRVVELEQNEGKANYIELFKGTNLRRTLIVCGIYAGQNLAGNLIANQAVFFFEQAGMTTDFSFALGIINSCLAMVAVAGSWILTTYFGRRTIYLWGTAFNVVMLVALGVSASVGTSSSASYAQACFGVIVSVWFAFTAAPASWVVIGETSAIRLRPLTTGIGRGAYYIIEIPCIFLGSYMLNPTGGNLGGKCGYVWGATGLICWIAAYFALPEMKGRSYREIDILFRRRIPARKFKSTQIELTEDD